MGDDYNRYPPRLLQGGRSRRGMSVGAKVVLWVGAVLAALMALFVVDDAAHSRWGNLPLDIGLLLFGFLLMWWSRGGGRRA